MSVFPKKILLATDGSGRSMSVLGVAESYGVAGKRPAKQILNVMRDENIGSVVIGCRDLGRFRDATGTGGSGTVVRETCCSVLAVRDDSGA